MPDPRLVTRDLVRAQARKKGRRSSRSTTVAVECAAVGCTNVICHVPRLDAPPGIPYRRVRISAASRAVTGWAPGMDGADVADVRDGDDVIPFWDTSGDTPFTWTVMCTRCGESHYLDPWPGPGTMAEAVAIAQARGHKRVRAVSGPLSGFEQSDPLAARDHGAPGSPEQRRRGT
jgi:hypothetical protein